MSRCRSTAHDGNSTTEAPPAVGGLGIETFLKPVTVQRLTEEGLARVRPTVEALAEAERMPAHAAAVRRPVS